jgi:hypothetical protein
MNTAAGGTEIAITACAIWTGIGIGVETGTGVTAMTAGGIMDGSAATTMGGDAANDRGIGTGILIATATVTPAEKTETTGINRRRPAPWLVA